VVRKKWQVAQKCKLDTVTTPHEVLGFRDPAAANSDSAAAGSYSREANVSNWVAEHYGPNNLYENVYPVNGDRRSAASPSPPPPPPPPTRLSTVANAAMACAMLKKRPPPPPPPRSEKTQLTTVVS
jgi:amyloid beta A4 precursor protein-binding family B protein 1-interacting protein